MTQDSQWLRLASHRKPIPITQHQLLAACNANVGRIMAGATLILVKNGMPTPCLMSEREYMRLKRLEEAEQRGNRPEPPSDEHTLPVEGSTEG